RSRLVAEDTMFGNCLLPERYSHSRKIKEKKDPGPALAISEVNSFSHTNMLWKVRIDIEHYQLCAFSFVYIEKSDSKGETLPFDFSRTANKQILHKHSVIQIEQITQLPREKTCIQTASQTDALPSQPLVPLNPIRVYKVTLYLLTCLYENLTGPLIPSILQYVWNKLSSERKKISVRKNVRYGPKKCNRLDIYLPDRVKNSRGLSTDDSRVGFPVIILISTSWNSGNRATCIPVAQNLQSQQYTVIVPDITLYPQGKISDMIADVQQCIYWTSTHARQFRGDPSQIYLMGHAAGATLAALTVIHDACAAMHVLPTNTTGVQLPVWNKAAKKTCLPRIRGLILFSGFYDMTYYYAYLYKLGLEHVHAMPRVMGNTSGSLLQCSPTYLIHHALKNTQKYEKLRMLLPEKVVLIHGENDTFNPSSSAQNFFYLLDSAGISVQLKIYKDIKHISPRIDLIVPTKKLCVLLLEDIKECCQGEQGEEQVIKKKSWDQREE
ncbi:15564_t:CDS:10, partial [Acaulospora morrowiae]